MDKIEDWNKKTIEQKLDDLKGMVPDEEFFLIWNGSVWCAGYMKTPGIMPEMLVSIEKAGESVADVIDKLHNELHQNDQG